jgi:hypothetical protein
MNMSKKVALPLWVALLLCVGVPVARGQSLWGYYPIKENDFNDYSGNNHHGTPVDGAVTVMNPERGWVASFNQEPEKPSRVNCGTDDPSAGGELTVSLWLYWQGTNDNWQGIAGKSFSFEDRRWILQLRDTDGRIQWGGADRFNKAIFAEASPAVEEWQYLVGTCDGETARVYLNNRLVGEGPGGFEPNAAPANVTLGFGEDRSDYDESLNGLLDEIHLFRRALSPDQVQALAGGVLPSFEKAREPTPPDGATDVQAALFRWTAGDGAKYHDLYLGTTAELGAEQLVLARSGVAMYYHAAGIEPGTTYYWRVDEVEEDGVTIHTGSVWSFTAQALTAYLPDPCDGAPDVSPRPTLTWQPGRDAVRHHVYLSNNQDAVTRGDQTADKGLVDEPSFSPGELQEARTYYWRVDEIGLGDEVVAGAVWSFRTFLQVDDFEAYTDNEGSRIFDTWIDGWGGNGTGSLAGYNVSPFCEQTVVHGGHQSMPLGYNNVDPPYYSEVEQEFPGAGNSSENYDIDTLVLHIHGRMDNSPTPLYVGLGDAHGNVGVVTYPDPNVVMLSKWIEWRIFMFDFMATGVDLTAVQKMVIGLGDRNNPTPGSAGLIYVDDIYAIKTLMMDPSQMMIPPQP